MLISRRHSRPLFTEKKDPFVKPARKKGFWWSLALIILGLVASMAWFHAEAATPETAAAMDKVNAGQMLLQPSAGGELVPALTQESRVHIKVSGMVAHVSLTQSFQNQSANWVEGTYVFPLPDKAAVNRMRMVIGERVIEGQIKEKEEAKQIYHEAKTVGKKASLVSQQRPNLFTTQVANIAPHETITVELEYIDAVAYDQGQFSLRFPMTITPRYIPGAPLQDGTNPDETTKPLAPGASGWAMNTDQVPDASEITPRMNPALPSAESPINPISVTAELDMGMPLQSVDSAYHNIILSRQDNRYTLRLAAGKVSMTQDFSLAWQPKHDNSPRAALFSEQVDGEDYALLMMVPPNQRTEQDAPTTGFPREAIFIIDTSGSMDGVSIEQARQGLLFALAQLKPDDRFNVISFNSSTHTLFSSAVSATPRNIDYAQRYVNGLQSGGGTEMLPALQAALRDEAEQGFIRQVMFITDGAVGNEAALFRTIHRNLGNSRLFTVGIGSAPNSHFMRKAAQFGRGSFTHIGRVSEVQEKMTALFTKLDSPVVSDIEIHWPEGTQVESYPKRLPDLYSGEPLMVAVKTSELKGSVVLSGQTANTPWQQEIQLNGAQDHSGVATGWAREKIASLLDEKTTGRQEPEVRQDVLEVALRHQLISPYTSFVAVEQPISRPTEEKLKQEAVLNARPKGQGPQSYAYPQTATGAPISLLWGTLLMLLAWVFKRVLPSSLRPRKGGAQ
ncbi:MAG: marine proteobacterial sortase target protein [Pseudomonadales bacterium]